MTQEPLWSLLLALWLLAWVLWLPAVCAGGRRV
jgi:hypothetical protein